MKIIAFVTGAITLGVLVMLIPIVMYTQFFVTTSCNQELGGSERNCEQAITGERDKFAVMTAGKIDEAAQAYGRLDTGPSPFPSSLFHVMVVVTTGLAAALGVSIYFKKRMKLV